LSQIINFSRLFITHKKQHTIDRNVVQYTIRYKNKQIRSRRTHNSAMINLVIYVSNSDISWTRTRTRII